MKADGWLLCGPLAGVTLAAGLLVLPAVDPGYSQIRQTVSEIGEVGAPAQLPFSVMLMLVGVLALLFSIAAYRVSVERGHGTFGCFLIGVLSILLAGLAMNPFPYPLHNVFGTSEIIVYQAPMVFALQWRKDPKAQTLVRFSWICFVALWISLALNFVVFFRNSEMWHAVKPFYGLVQRSLFAGLCVWLIGTGLLLWKIRHQSKFTSEVRDRDTSRS